MAILSPQVISRRNLLFSAAAAATPGREALVSISIDLEMARNYPTWDQTHWDYEKGNLNDAAKQYALHGTVVKATTVKQGSHVCVPMNGLLLLRLSRAFRMAP